MANERESHGVQEEVVDAAAVVALSSLPAKDIDALDVKVSSLGTLFYYLAARDRV